MVDIIEAKEADIRAVTDIYAYNVAHGTGTFALEPPVYDEMLAGFHNVKRMRLPYLVAVEDGQVIGFAYAGPFRTRPGYRYGVEDSVYLAPGHTSKGIGKALLNRLIDLSIERGMYRMFGVIGDSDNLASINLHEACGFVHTGRLPEAGYKFGRWLDVVFMTRELQPLENPPIGEGWAD